MGARDASDNLWPELYTKCHLRIRSEADQVVEVIRFDTLPARGISIVSGPGWGFNHQREYSVQLHTVSSTQTDSPTNAQATSAEGSEPTGRGVFRS